MHVHTSIDSLCRDDTDMPPKPPNFQTHPVFEVSLKWTYTYHNYYYVFISMYIHVLLIFVSIVRCT